MSTSKSNNRCPPGFVAMWPAVLPVLKHAEDCGYHWLLEFEGTQAELLAAGIAEPFMFEITTKTGSKTDSDEFGDKYQIRRRPKGIFALTRWFFPTDATDPMCPKQQRLNLWKLHGASVVALVDEAIARAMHSAIR